jgi:hypothetical protein
VRSRSSAICVLAVALVGCSAPGEARPDTETASRWQRLCVAGGCLTGGQDWSADGPSEGSVLASPEWQAFLGSRHDEVVPFLLDRIDSTDATSVHVCPFQNAHEGELAVYALQHVMRANWMESHRQDALRKVLASPSGRERVKRYFAR